ncbi:hypothetical protein F2Q69_00006894 [Brassica cretica]|uniref:CCHC-type domain-containing protein n=1 Tax=Brassica cretica TaxID=69181 RepID=A0A8S9NZJ7_BRACR|nr:hypothetical protein F2Q69_00006894 [Brassica cretica]
MPKLDERTEKLEVARSMRSGCGGNYLAWYVASEALGVAVKMITASGVTNRSTRWISQARGVAMHATGPCGQTCGGRGVSFHGDRPCIQTGRGRGVILHETETCSQPCGARGVAPHASGAMRSDTRAATRLVPDCSWRRCCSSEERLVLVEAISRSVWTWVYLRRSRKGSDRISRVWGQGHGQPKTLANAECLDDIAKLWIVRWLITGQVMMDEIGYEERVWIGQAEHWATDLIRMMDMALVRYLDTIGALCREQDPFMYEATMIRNFMYGLKPEVGSRLAGSNFISLSDRVEKAVNVGTVLEAERKIIPHSGGHTKFSQGGRPNFNKGPRFNKGKGKKFGGQTNYRSNTVVCYICDQPGHISNFCSNRQRSNQQGYSSLRMEEVTCFFCGRKGHYASSCPNKPIPSTPLAIRAPPSRPAIEPAPKKQNLGGRVYALGVENPNNAGPSSGPIRGIGCLTSSVY